MTTEAGRRLLSETWDNFDAKPWGSMADHVAAIEDEAREQHEATLRERGWRDEYEVATDAAMNFGDGQAEARAALLAELEADIYDSLGHDLRELAEGAEKSLHCIWPTMMLRLLDLIRKAGEK